ncbi:multicopper oxidase domain-containing protein [Arcticibacter eurypsychrophilus]|uniref:multicopper oxidase domain-containing protein n=1 Tax=Arcticibacter eurypsychrophilus TaxID=1434752 RepID=UPI00084DF2A4|nr:multicopper oxidase domain-containing protein [Arcticibacter eurypsychrophilus]
MKRILLYVFFLGFYTIASGQPQVYVCPMHPEVMSNKPGKCPKCGMELVEKRVKSPAKSAPAQKHDPVKSAAPVGIKIKSASKTKADHTTPAPVLNEERNAEKAGHKVKTAEVTYSPKMVRYDLYVNDTTVNFTGKKKKAVAINGSIPAPTLTFTEGDTAEIYVHNKMDVETSVHWHGVFLPNRFDGVPNLTQMPIKPHSTYVYKFPVIQNGTYWYHSHTKLQEQSGMYGALIFNKKNEPKIPTIPIVLSDWTDMNPREVDRSLHNATDWFAIKKGTSQSYAEAIQKGYFKTKLNNEWKRMSAMDVSDVYYDKFLANGKPSIKYSRFKAGDKVRLRIINGGASTYFWLTYSGGKITVVGNDGNDVVPVDVDRLLIAVSETYDVIITIPQDMSYEFLATAEDRTKSTSIWLGEGMKMPAKPLGKLKYFEGMEMMNGMMKMNGDMASTGMEMSNQQMDMNTVMYPETTGEQYGRLKSKPDEIVDLDSIVAKPEPIKEDITKADPQMKGHDMHTKSSMNMEMSEDLVTLNYAMLKSPEKSTLRPGPLRTLNFELTGNMNRYVWTIDNKTVSESDKILIKKGENIRIIIYNNSMMRHPMHLHGHDFRVLNGQGEYAPLKNVLDIMPMERDTIEFAATESGDWFFHCHILYHMMSGMGRVFSYVGSAPNPDIPNPKLAQRKLFADDRMPHFMANAGFESNGSDGEAMLCNTRYRLSTEWRIGLKSEDGNESETYFGRYLGKMQWIFPFIGFDYHYNPRRNISEKNLFGQTSNQSNRKALVAGIQYVLPMLVNAEARLDSKGKFRFQLVRKDIPVTARLSATIMGNTDKEYMGGLRYTVTKYFSLSTHYDSDIGYGAGVTLTY